MGHKNNYFLWLRRSPKVVSLCDLYLSKKWVSHILFQVPILRKCARANVRV